MVAVLLMAAPASFLRAQEQYAASPADLLDGTVSGVRVSSVDGNPDGARNVNIRGLNTIRGDSQPLWVVDGVILSNELTRNLDGFWQFGEASYSAPLNGIPFINPEEIERIEILKDVSATALYGALGANGVIIITTKKGSAGQKLKVTYDGNVSFGTLTNKLQTLTGDEVRAYAMALGYSKEEMKYLGTANTNWQDQVYRTAVSTDHNISLMGGTKHMPYRASIGYTLNNGTIKSSQMQRVTAALNLNPSFLDNHLTFNLNAKGMYIYNSYEPGVVGASLSIHHALPIWTSSRPGKD